MTILLSLFPSHDKNIVYINITTSFWFILGTLLAIYTPKRKISACEVTKNGQHVILALQGYQTLFTLQLRGPGIEECELAETYGDEENNGKSWQLTDEV